jgi:hypothetical protein
MTEQESRDGRRGGDHHVLPQAVGDRVLARASELDAAIRSGASVAQLRSAALEAGISEAAFDAALSEVERGSRVKEKRWPPWWQRRFLAFSAAFVLAGLAVTTVRMLTPARVPPAVTVEVVQESILLRCISHADAEAFVRPYVAGANTTVQYGSTDAGRVLIVSGTRQQLAAAREALAKHEATLPACAVPGGTATP